MYNHTRWRRLAAGLIGVGALMIGLALLPGRLARADETVRLFDDERFFEEPDFFLADLEAFLRAQPGSLSSAAVTCGGHTCTAAESLYYASATFHYSVNVKLLVTLVEMQSGLVTQSNLPRSRIHAPMGLSAPAGFEAQLTHVAEALVEAYFSYAPDATIKFADGSSYAVPSTTNAASYAIMAVLAELAPERAAWERQVEPRCGAFATTFERLFGGAGPLALAQGPFPGDGDLAFLYQPYSGKPVWMSGHVDHHFPNYTRDGTVVIYTGESSASCDPYCYDGHDGYDHASYGRDVVAAADGIADIVRVNYAEPGMSEWCPAPYTPVNAIVIRHDPDGDGQYEYKTRYWHLQSIADNPSQGRVWQVGDEIQKGAVLGPTGSTGCSAGPHLHFSVTRSGRVFDPYGWGGDYTDPWEPNFWLWADSNAPYGAETMGIDSPGSNAYITGTVSIAGWAINQHYGPGSGVERVAIYLDGEARAGQYLGEATYGDVRDDVADAFGDARFSESGFHVTWDTSALISGRHVLYVYARSIQHQNWFFSRRAVIVGSLLYHHTTYLPVVLKAP